MKNDLTLFKNPGTDLVCFSHLRWNFVYQRPQHLMSRFSKKHRVFFVEEALFHDAADTFEIKRVDKNILVVTLFLQENSKDESSIIQRQKSLITTLFLEKEIQRYIAWYYTPMALKFTSHLNPAAIVYDCMDELSAFKFAPVELKLLELELFSKAHLVFTGGVSLFESKKNSHQNIFAMPSSIDKAHFRQAREKLSGAAEQQHIPRPRFGFYGVIDERFNINLIRKVARKRPDWQFIFVGPVVKIDPALLPQESNIHYLGSKSYQELPLYLSGWDFALLPFEKNDSTKFISPTKTPEYLAGGKPVISTSITDVVNPYGVNELVYIADNATAFIKAAETELAKTNEQKQVWLAKVDAFLKNMSWDYTAELMLDKIQECLAVTNNMSRRNLKSVA